MELQNVFTAFDRNTAVVKAYQDNIKRLEDTEELYYLDPCCIENAPTILDENGEVVPYKAALHCELIEEFNAISDKTYDALDLTELQPVYNFFGQVDLDVGADYIVVLDKNKNYKLV